MDFEREEFTGAVVPVWCSEVIGALSCVVHVNNVDAVAVMDTGSGISLLSDIFATEMKLLRRPWSGPMVTVVSDDTFSIEEEVTVSVELPQRGLSGRCGIIRNSMFDILLGVDFLNQSRFLVDFRNLSLINPEVEVPQSAPLFMMNKLVEYHHNLVPNAEVHKKIMEDDLGSSDEQPEEQQNVSIYETLQKAVGEDLDGLLDMEEMWVPASTRLNKAWPPNEIDPALWDNLIIGAQQKRDEKTKVTTV